MNIRLAGPDDANAVAEVFIPSFGSFTFLPRLHTDEEHRAYVRERLIPQHEVWVAVEDGRVVGFAALTPDVLSHFYVHPEEQGRGVGSALLAKARERRPAGFTLWVFQQNERARRFYEARGCRLLELTDGLANEEKTPDALYEWRP